MIGIRLILRIWYYVINFSSPTIDQEIIIRGAKRYQLRPGSILIDRSQFEEVAYSALKKTITGALVTELEATATLYRVIILRILTITGLSRFKRT